MRRADLIAQLGAAVLDIEPMLEPVPWRHQLADLCAAARCAFGAIAVSVAELRPDGLRYVAASGAGAEAIVGTALPLDRGLAGYVAVTGQAVAVDRPSDDPRFAREVAERTGHIPDTLLIVPVTAPGGQVAGVLSVLDRTVGSADALELGSAFAAMAAHPLTALGDAARSAHLLFAAFARAAAAGDRTLAPALRRELLRVPEPTGELASIAATLNVVRGADPAVRERLLALIDDLVALVVAGRPR